MVLKRNSKSFQGKIFLSQFCLKPAVTNDVEQINVLKMYLLYEIL